MNRKMIAVTTLLPLLFSMFSCGVLPPVNTSEFNWKMNGTFVYVDNTFEKWNISITGNIYIAENEENKLNIEIRSNEKFPYLFSKPESHYSSSNQKNNDLPHLMICLTYAYNKQTNQSTKTFFALDLEEEYFIALFEDIPSCYYVAATKENVTHEQLVTHFSDFITSYSQNIWE